MKAKHDESLFKLADEISHLVSKLPAGTKHPIQNRCSKIKVITKKAFNMNTNTDYMTELPQEKFIAKRAILEALLAGRHLSQMDCKEFMVEDMRTPISHMKVNEEFPETHELKSRFIVTPVRKARIKEYWLERRAEA